MDWRTTIVTIQILSPRCTQRAIIYSPRTRLNEGIRVGLSNWQLDVLLSVPAILIESNA